MSDVEVSKLWLSVKWDIETKIITGVYKGGERLPTITELSQIYNVGRSTIQKVINELCEETTLTTRGIKGTYVNPFIKGKLLYNHKQVLRERYKELISNASEIGLSVSDITEDDTDIFASDILQ